MRYINENAINEFKEWLIREDKSELTIQKYIRDVTAFYRYCNSREVSADLAVAYKKYLIDKEYAPASINSMIAAINSFFAFKGWKDIEIKPIRIQKQMFISEEKELTRSEYIRLCKTAEKKNRKLSLVIQTICGTGIRVSELKFITVEAVKTGEANIICKGKNRRIFIVKELRKKLLAFAAQKKIEEGMIFLSRDGKELNRTYIWKAMKKLCKEAAVNPLKVFPHNLRHLFARQFYAIKKDVAKLADILGHSSIETTRIYIMSTGEEHRRYMEEMRLII